VKTSGNLLIGRGRILTPLSRFRYRWLRLRTGHALFLQGDAWLGAMGSVARMATLPVLLLVDLLWWPLAEVTQARSGWTVVRVDFHDVDAEFVRLAEATSKAEAEKLREQIAMRRNTG
jgi:hypothetical protein